MKTIITLLCSLICFTLLARNMNEIQYIQHEPHYEPKKVTGSLVTFVYDVPYLTACGIFPPFEVLNNILKNGGGDAGMSPGTSWEPFALTKNEYNELWEAIERTDPKTLSNIARYTLVKFKRDHELENIHDQFKWLKSACDKHREWFFSEQAKNSA